MHKSVSAEMDEKKRVREIISWDAYTSGLKTGAVWSTVMAGLVYSANRYHKGFRTRLGVSGKWALVVSAYLAGFAIQSEKKLLAGAHNPEQYLATLDPNYVEISSKKSTLPLYQRVGNYVYDFPYRTLGMVGVPLVGGIYAYQHANRGISASQQVMHTRIYGQAAVVVLLLSSMAFHDYMAKHGRFEEVEEAEESAETQKVSA